MSISRSGALAALLGVSILSMVACESDNVTSPHNNQPGTSGSEWVTRIARTEPDVDLYAVYWDARGSSYYLGGDQTTSMQSTDGLDWQLVTAHGSTRVVGYAAAGSGVITVANTGRLDCGRCQDARYGQYGWEFTSIASNNSIAVIVGVSGHVVVHTGETQQEYDTGIGADFTDIAVETGMPFMATASDGIVRSSPDGIAWTAVSDTHSGKLRAIAVHGVSVVVLGENGEILQSADQGKTWKTIPGYSGLNDVTWNGSIFTAVGDNGQILDETPGLPWYAASTGLTTTLRTVTGGPRLVVAGDAGTILVSNDGREWEHVQPAREMDFTDVVWTGNKFIAGGEGLSASSIPIFLSDDGIDWNPVESVEDTWSIWGIQALAVHGTRAVASATAFGDWNGAYHQHAKLYASDDFQNWHIVHEAWDSYYAAEVLYLDGQFIAETSDEVLRSVDGENWTSEPLANYPFFAQVHSVTVRDNLAYGMDWYGNILSSSDLKSAQPAGKIDFPGSKTDISWTGSEFLACGYNSPERVWWSPDGHEWKAMNPGTTLNLWGIAGSDKRWVVVGEGGLIRTRDR